MNPSSARLTLGPSPSGDAGEPVKRIVLLDVAKGLGILLVVFGHNRWVADHFMSLDRVIASFRLPFFFFVSGVTFPMLRSVGQVALKRADAMLKPFAVTVLLLAVWQILHHHSSLEFLALELVYATGFTLSWEPLWFLPHLWLLSVFAAVVANALGKRFEVRSVRIALLTVVLVVGYVVLKQFHNPMQDNVCLHMTTFSLRLLECGLPFSADLVLICSFYFLLGHFCASYAKAFQPRVPFVLLAALTFVLLLLKFDYTIILNFRLYDGLVVSTVQALAAIYLALSCCYVISHLACAQRVLAYIGSGSLFVLIFHYVLQEKLFVLLSNAFGPSSWVSLTALVLAVAACLALWEMTKRNYILSTLFLPIKNVALPRAPATPAAQHGS